MFFFFWDPTVAELQTAQVQAFTAGVDAVRKRYPSMTIGQLSTLLEAVVPRTPDGQEVFDLRQLAAAMALPYSTVARHSDVLGAGVGEKNGLGLVEKRPVPGQRKNKGLMLSLNGKLLLSQIDRAMSERIEQTSLSGATS